MATITVAPSATRAAVAVVGAAVVAGVAPATVVVAPAATVVDVPVTSSRPASLLSIERKIREPTATAINARTIVSGADRRTRVADASRAAALAGPHPTGISRIAHNPLLTAFPYHYAPPCCSLGERGVSSVVCGELPSINARRRRNRRRWKRRITSGCGPSPRGVRVPGPTLHSTRRYGTRSAPG